MESSLIQFYRNIGTNASGMNYSDAISFSFEGLENVHDYIQWLFPNVDPSRCNVNAPVFSVDDIQLFRTDEQLRSAARVALTKMLVFYGFDITFCEHGHCRVTRNNHFDARQQRWATPGNHNFLRITRIIKFLRLILMYEEAENVFNAMVGVYADHPETVGKKTLTFWLEAVKINLTNP